MKRDKTVIYMPIDKPETAKVIRSQLFEILQTTQRDTAPADADDIVLGVLSESGGLPATPLAAADKVDGTRTLAWKTKDEADFAVVQYAEEDDEEGEE